MKNRMRMLVAAFGIVCGIGLAFPVQQVAAEENTDDTTQDSAVIPEHISIGGTDVSGMSLDEANAVVQQYVDQYQDVTFTLTADDKSIEADGDDIGLCAKNADVTERALNYGKEGNLIERFKANADMQAGKEKDFSISLTSDTATVEAFLNENKSDLVTEAVDNTVKRVDGKFEYVEGSEGVTLMTGKSAVKIADFISTDWDGKDASIELLTEKDEPRGTKEELESIQDVLGSYHTDFGTVVNGRTNNIKTGASKLDGLVVYPKVIEKHLMAELPFMATENIMMDAVKAGGDRQELHERIRQLSMEAGRNVKEKGLDNNLLELIAADPAFGLSLEDLQACMEPSRYVGRAPKQVDEFLSEVVNPILDANKEDLGMTAEINV